MCYYGMTQVMSKSIGWRGIKKLIFYAILGLFNPALQILQATTFHTSLYSHLYDNDYYVLIVNRVFLTVRNEWKVKYHPEVEYYLINMKKLLHGHKSGLYVSAVTNTKKMETGQRIYGRCKLNGELIYAGGSLH